MVLPVRHIFQKMMVQILQGIEGVICYIDDMRDTCKILKKSQKDKVCNLKVKREMFFLPEQHSLFRL